ncbi:MAG: homing endonuclease associated repeat-containing protein [Solirubrobacteraceae bacterium]
MTPALTSGSTATTNCNPAKPGGQPDSGGRPRPLSDRDREMFELRAAGWTLRQIGERYGISRQRVDEIVRDRGGPELPDVIEARRAREAEIMRKRSEEIRQWWRAGLPVTIIAARLGLPAARVQRSIDSVLTPMDRAHRNRSIVMRTRTRRYTDQQLIDGVREVAAQIGRTPTQEEYRAHAQELGLASILTLGKRFGGWQAAVVAADLEPLPHGRGSGSRRVWDTEACWRALERVADQLGNPPRFQSYVVLSTGRPDLPSGPTVRNQLGPWIDIVIELSARRTSGSGVAPTD